MRVASTLVARSRSVRKANLVWSMAVVFGAGCGSAPPDEPVLTAAEADTPASPPTIDISRSLAITDLPTLEATDKHGRLRFSLERVLGQIVATSGTQHGSALELYRRIFDTNNLKASSYFADGYHCDDEKDGSNNPALNGFPLQCPRQEGALADKNTYNPFCSGAGCAPYTPVAITNRLDLAASNGQTCGQYRIVFGKGTNGQTPLALAGNPNIFDRNLIIFEAVVRNPDPHKGFAGCAPVVKYWAGLSAINDPAKRAKALDRFFFDGIAGVGPALSFDNFTGAVDPHTGMQLSGQIRCNQFMNTLQGQPWQLREYNLERSCSSGHGHHSCTAKVRLVTSKTNPAATLFDDNDTSPAALAFRDPANAGGFFGQLSSLAANDLNLIGMGGLDPAYNSGQSTSSPAFIGPVLDDTNYNKIFNPSGAFAGNLQAALTQMGSSLTPTEIVRRAQTQACAGCHELATSSAFFFGGVQGANLLGDGLEWPDAALAFTQTSEIVLTPLSPGVTCDTTCTADPTSCQCAWDLSPAMKNVFLPFRQQGMATYLANLPRSHGHGHGHGDDDFDYDHDCNDDD